MADDNLPAQSADAADGTPALFDEQAADHIRRVWHEGRWLYSIIDVIGFLADAKIPRKYWYDLKRRLAQDEGFAGAAARCYTLKIPASDGKLRETDCADFATMMELLAFLPAWGRSQKERADSEEDEANGDAGIYTITNILTQEQYIGSSINIYKRLTQHRSLLRRGNHHAPRLQEAWNRHGAANFQFAVLEHVSNVRVLPTVEQQYLDTLKPVYNGAEVAVNSSAAVPISSDRLRAVIVELYESGGSEMQSPLLRAIKDAMMMGALRPGPNFHLLLEAAHASVAQKAG